jgi:hypothetical protein
MKKYFCQLAALFYRAIVTPLPPHFSPHHILPADVNYSTSKTLLYFQS